VAAERRIRRRGSPITDELRLNLKTTRSCSQQSKDTRWFWTTLLDPEPMNDSVYVCVVLSQLLNVCRWKDADMTVEFTLPPTILLLAVYWYHVTCTCSRHHPQITSRQFYFTDWKFLT